MKKQISFIAIAIAVAMISLLASCSDKEEQEGSDITQQSILVFMPWSGSDSSTGLYYSLLENLDSMEAGIKAQKGLKNTRLFVALARNSSTTELYEVKYKDGNCTHQAIQNYDSKECSTADGIASIINKVKQTSTALNYAMIIGCHGCGWTSKADWQQYPYRMKAKNIEAAHAESFEFPTTRFFGSVDDMRYAIDITTLSDAIKQTGTKMQYILFDNCYMANVETAYELKDVTNFMVASTSEIMAVGMPYKMMWSYLASATPNYDQIVNAYYNFYSSYSYPYGSISAIDCRQMDDLAKIMKKINAQHTFDASRRDSIQIMGGFNPTLFYDLGSYVDNLCNDNDLKSQFNKQMAKVVKYKKSTSLLYTYLYRSTGPWHIKVDHYSGITTSAPSINPVAEHGWNNTKWAKEVKRDE